MTATRSLVVIEWRDTFNPHEDPDWMGVNWIARGCLTTVKEHTLSATPALVNTVTKGTDVKCEPVLLISSRSFQYEK